MLTWVSNNEQLIQQLTNLSLISFGISVVVLPIVVMKLPADYFISKKREPSWRTQKHPFTWGLLLLAKNLIGLILILAGIAMLVLPGQGVLTILIGLGMSNFPGKYALERRIACQPAIGKALKKIREFTGKPALLIPADPNDDT